MRRITTWCGNVSPDGKHTCSLYPNHIPPNVHKSNHLAVTWTDEEDE